jgi:hypothetical protein
MDEVTAIAPSLTAEAQHLGTPKKIDFKHPYKH